MHDEPDPEDDDVAVVPWPSDHPDAVHAQSEPRFIIQLGDRFYFTEAVRSFRMGDDIPNDENNFAVQSDNYLREFGEKHGVKAAKFDEGDFIGPAAGQQADF